MNWPCYCKTFGQDKTYIHHTVTNDKKSRIWPSNNWRKQIKFIRGAWNAGGWAKLGVCQEQLEGQKGRTLLFPAGHCALWGCGLLLDPTWSSECTVAAAYNVFKTRNMLPNSPNQNMERCWSLIPLKSWQQWRHISFLNFLSRAAPAREFCFFYSTNEWRLQSLAEHREAGLNPISIPPSWIL